MGRALGGKECLRVRKLGDFVVPLDPTPPLKGRRCQSLTRLPRSGWESVRRRGQALVHAPGRVLAPLPSGALALFFKPPGQP